jgi:hypothetical protein
MLSVNNIVILAGSMGLHHPIGRYRGNSGSISAKDVYVRSFADKMGVAIGQGMARAGSFQLMPRSLPGA